MFLILLGSASNMAVGEKQPSGIFPLDALKGAEPSEINGNLYVWKGSNPLRINEQLVNVSISARKTAIESGNGAFDIQFTVGDPSKKRIEAWSIMANRGDRPILDLYLQRTIGPSLLLPQVPEAAKIARFYSDRAQLFSKRQGAFNLLDVVGVLATINRVTRAVLASKLA